MEIAAQVQRANIVEENSIATVRSKQVIRKCLRCRR